MLLGEKCGRWESPIVAFLRHLRSGKMQNQKNVAFGAQGHVYLSNESFGPWNKIIHQHRYPKTQSVFQRGVCSERKAPFWLLRYPKQGVYYCIFFISCSFDLAVGPKPLSETVFLAFFFHTSKHPPFTNFSSSRILSAFFFDGGFSYSASRDF